MKNFIFVLFVFFSNFIWSQNYSFQGSISEEVLQNYLDKRVSMIGMCTDGLNDVENYPESVREADIDGLIDMGAKYINRMVGWWEYPSPSDDDLWPKFMQRIDDNIEKIHAGDPEIIIEAGLMEVLTNSVNTPGLIPNYVFEAFGIAPRLLNKENMIYSEEDAEVIRIYTNPSPGSGVEIGDRRSWIPDITRIETQIWYYYLATTYIQKGIEALHFGQSTLINRKDIGNKELWGLIQKIRDYAKDYNRGIVVINGSPAYYEPDLQMTLNEWQYYFPESDYDSHLLYDFWEAKLHLKEDPNNCPSAYIDGASIPNMDFTNIGGIHPQGFRVKENFASYVFDFDDVKEITGCEAIGEQHVYGWDESSWFAFSNPIFRKTFLKYAHYKIKCLRDNGTLTMPGRIPVKTQPSNQNEGPEIFYNWRGVHPTINGEPVLEGDGELEVMKEIWSGIYDSDNTLNLVDFTEKHLFSGTGSDVKNNIVFNGDNRIYFVTPSGTIQGYINYEGVWLKVSPSWSAQANGVPVASQVKAKNCDDCMVVDQSGDNIYYIGEDNKVHSFRIQDDWTYFYEELNVDYSHLYQENLEINLEAIHSLRITEDNILFFVGELQQNHIIADYNKDGVINFQDFIYWMELNSQFEDPENYIFGLYPSQELFTDYFAFSPQLNNLNTPLNNQQGAGAKMLLNETSNDLIYLGSDDLLYNIKYSILNANVFEFEYFPIIQINNYLNQVNNTLADFCINSNSEFFIASDSPFSDQLSLLKFDNPYLNSLPLSTPQNLRISAEVNGTPLNDQISFKSSLKCLKGGICFIGENNQVVGYRETSQGFNYNPYLELPEDKKAYSLEVKDKVYFSSFPGENELHYFDFKEDYCSNPNLLDFDEGQFSENITREFVNKEVEAKIDQEDLKLKVSPNPIIGSTLRFEVPSFEGHTKVQLKVLDSRTVEIYTNDSFELSQYNEIDIDLKGSGICFLIINGEYFVLAEKVIFAN